MLPPPSSNTLDIGHDVGQDKIASRGAALSQLFKLWNVAGIGKGDWEERFYLLVFMQCAWRIPQTSQPVPHSKRAAAAATRPKSRTSPLSAIVFLPDISAERNEQQAAN